jgi:uncharacterized protein YjaZ
MSTLSETVRIPVGYSSSFVEKIKHILTEAQSKYGESDKNYTIIEIKIDNNASQPGHWFPPNCKDILIFLTYQCLEDKDRAVYQIAHEIIHCLSPIGYANPKVLEEGLAEYFAIEYAKNNGHGNWSPDIDKYEKALKLFKKLIMIDSDIIRKVRLIQPIISFITSDNLIETNDKIPSDLADSLTMKF